MDNIKNIKAKVKKVSIKNSHNKKVGIGYMGYMDTGVYKESSHITRLTKEHALEDAEIMRGSLLDEILASHMRSKINY